MKKQRRWLILLAVIVIGLVAGLYALRPFWPNPLCTSSLNRVASFERLDRCIARTVERRDLAGLAVAVVVDDEIAFSQGYGYANIAEQQPVTPDTPFALASITKAVTATALMQAVEAGDLDLDAPVGDVVGFPVENPNRPGERITLRHLATHTSGIIDSDAYDDSYAPGDPQIALGDFLQGYLVPGGVTYSADANFAADGPGTRFEYSNIGAGLAGYAVEAATGTRLDHYTQASIFDPLGMTHAGWFLADFDDISQIATPYQVSDEGHVALEQYGFPTYPDGLLRASANDLATFMAAIMNGGELHGVRILEAETVAAMLAPQFPDAQVDFFKRAVEYPGFEQDIFWFRYRGWIGHDGGDDGVITFMHYDPQTSVGVVVLINQSDMDTYMAGRRLTALVLNSGSRLASN